MLAAVAIATLRHGGTLEETYTPAGRIFLQSGKDLRPVQALIGSGGYLSLFDLGKPIRELFHRLATGGLEAGSKGSGKMEMGSMGPGRVEAGSVERERGTKGESGLLESSSHGSARIHLVPKNPSYFRDALYLFPLLGNYAKEYPEEVSRLAIETLVPESKDTVDRLFEESGPG